VDAQLAEGASARFYLSGPAVGYQLMHSGGMVHTAFVYVAPRDGFRQFSGPLPGGLTAQGTRAEVRRRFGNPSRSGEAQTFPDIGHQGAWDRFEVGPVCIHFQYMGSGERIALVTLMAAGTAP
jgi:hypothetical protein